MRLVCELSGIERFAKGGGGGVFDQDRLDLRRTTSLNPINLLP